MEKVLFIQSSSHPEEPYKMHFSVEGESIRLRCYCPAGSEQMLCKHVIAVASGDRKILFHTTDPALFDEALLVLEKSGARKKCAEMLSAVAVIDREFKTIKKQFDDRRRALKEDFCRCLRDGSSF